MKKPRNKKEGAKAPAHQPRQAFVYARDLRVGDVIRLHDSIPAGTGWETKTITGLIVSVDTKSLDVYSRTIIKLSDIEWPTETPQERRLSNESLVPLIGVDI